MGFPLLFLLSCTSFQEAGKVLRNEKVNTTDEFLVKKKEPLVMPPDLNEVPEPDTIKSKREKNNQEFKIPNKCPCGKFQIIKLNNETVQRCNGGSKCPYQYVESLKHSKYHYNAKTFKTIESCVPRFFSSLLWGWATLIYY